MTALESFITRMIVTAAMVSLKEGKVKYRTYFVDTGIYVACREAVDAALTEQGHENVIIK